MNIAIMERSMMEIAMAASLIILGLSTAIAGGFAFDVIMSMWSRQVHHRSVYCRRDGNAPSV